METHPAIVVVAYNRKESLARLLGSLRRANLPPCLVPLVISIDFENSNEHDQVKELAESFDWHNGPKRLILHKENLGLREHILRCGDLSREFGSIVLLEDDISVGVEFYNYTRKALAFSESKDYIAGVSLYDHRTNYLNNLPFDPIFDGFDNYYMQIVSSWGQAWSESQWNEFRNWYESLRVSLEPVDHVPEFAPIPIRIAKWPTSSWAKYFIWYLVDSKRYFFYPRFPHSTNNSDSGTHVGGSTNLWQVPLSVRSSEFRFSTVGESLAVYDSFFEIFPDKLKQFAPELNGFEFDVDLWGAKQDEVLKSDFVLSSRVAERAVKRFRLVQKPLEANFNYEQLCLAGELGVFSLTKKEDLKRQSNLSLSYWSNVQYFFGKLPIGKITKSLIRYAFKGRS